jgi:hypothetical protein
MALKQLPAVGRDPVGVALGLHERDAAPTCATYTGDQERPTVVVSRGRVAGVASPLRGKLRDGVAVPEAAPGDGPFPQEVSRSVEISRQLVVTRPAGQDPR